jgi:hypothetical protein
MNKFINSLILISILFITMFFLCGVEKSYAVGDANPDPLAFCSDFPDSDVCTQKNNDPEGNKVGGTGGVFIKIVNIIIYLTASLSILMVIIGAFKYVVSGGEGSQTKSAKDTILYALVGLFIAISSFAIVRFAISRI